MVNSRTQSFTSQNRQRTYTVPTDAASVQIEAIGGKGKDRFNTDSGLYGARPGTAGGDGGYAQATLSVNGGEVFTVHVGKNATTANQDPTPSTYGSYAEGETGESGGRYNFRRAADTPPGGEGGSGTVVTLNGNRKIVAGGGGGGATDSRIDPGGRYGHGGDGGAGGTPYGGSGGTGENRNTNTPLTTGEDGSGYAVGSATNVTIGSSNSDPKVIFTAFLPPDRITDISSSASPNKVEVNWNQPSNNGTLYLYRYNNNPKNASQIASFDASNSSYEDNSVSNNQTYGYYLVQEYKQATRESKATVSATPSDVVQVYRNGNWEPATLQKL